MPDVKRVVLAYSGGLDTSVILRWLIETYECEVVAYCADLGQGEELIPIRDKALKTGAVGVHVVDLRETFVRDFIFPMLRANAVYEGAYLLGTSIARPLIAQAQVEIALKERADAVAHGATGKGNDQVRFELTYAALAPQLRVIAPWREWDLTSRSALMEFARRHDIPVEVLLEFEHGDPVAVDGRRLGPVELLTALNRLGGEHGIGRVDLVENRFVGMKSRGVYETPGGTIVHVARRALESLTLDREVLHLRDGLVPRYAEMIYYGFWFAPERRALQTLMDECAQDVTGTVRLKLYKGNVTVAGRRSPRSLYRTDFATFEADTVYRQRDAEGFINLNALRLRIRSLRDRRS